MRDRLMAINPELQLTVISTFLNPDEMETLVSTGGFDYVVDCIDSVTPKLYLITTALKHNIPLMSSMGAGGRFDPTQLKISDIFESYNCPFAFYIRKRLRKMGVRQGFPVVFSSELPRRESIMRTDGNNFKRSAYGTMSWVPAAFGGACASVVVRKLIGEKV
jgi:tRNA A37 threonylcarbamoyladenosine dehydratase